MTMLLSSASITFILLSLFFTSSAAQTSCSNHTFTSQSLFTCCQDLPYLNAHLHWTYLKSTKQAKIAFRVQHTPKGWIAWAINPYRRGMVGSQALVAFRNSRGRMSAYTTSITGYNPSMQPRTLQFRVSKLSAEYANNEMIIFAVVGPLTGGPVVNQVWQVGSLDQNGVPQMHAMELQNLQSTGVIDFSSSLLAFCIPKDPILIGGSLVNQVWQAGSLVLDDIPQMHAVSQQNLQSTGELDFLSD